MGNKHFAMAPIVRHTEMGTPIAQGQCLCGWRGEETGQRKAERDAYSHEFANGGRSVA